MIHLSPATFAVLDGSHTGLRTALQQAVELEHATIPTYLFALYSIRPDAVRAGRNTEVYALLRSVVLEEMLHMVTACNLLNAVGGTPRLDRREFVPRYPGPLPGAVEGQLTVRLRRFSIEQVRDVFMEIEEPEHKSFAEAQVNPPLTIGGFYHRILEHIRQLGADIFVTDTSRQVTEVLGRRTVVSVTNLKSATQAIEAIVEQGEGTGRLPFDDHDELAHYYKFAEIVHGRHLIPNPDYQPEAPRFAYNGTPIAFDPDGVSLVIDDPHSSAYAEGSQVRRASDIFNYTYTNLLKCLQRAVSGAPSKITDAIPLMESLRHQALDLMSVPLANGAHAGPTFEYQNTCP